MPQSDYVHLVDGASERRAAISYQLLERGLHVEIYDDVGELSRMRPLADGHREVTYPQQGALLVSDDEDIDFADLHETLHDHACYIPLVAYSTATPPARRVVDAIKAGARDYLVLPEDYPRVVERIADVVEQAEEIAIRNRRADAAQRRIRQLSNRELQVLKGVAAGRASRDIARVLGISPRTVEIHRANANNKLVVGNSIEAVGVLIASGFRPTDPIPEDEVDLMLKPDADRKAIRR